MSILKKLSVATAGLAFTALGTVIMASTANAVSITIENSGFESPPAPSQAGGQFYTVNNITSWQSNGTNGVFNPSASSANTGTTYFNEPVPQGTQTAWSNGGNIFQQLSNNLNADTTYTLSVAVGQRNDQPFPGYNVELLAGNTVLAFNNSVNLSPGTFAQVNVNYTTTSGDPFIGQRLAIRLSSTGAQTNFDNVTLNAVSNAANVAVPFNFSPGLGILVLGAWGAMTGIKSTVRKQKCSGSAFSNN